MPMPAPFDGYRRSRLWVSTSLVSVARNRYSVPCELAGTGSRRAAIPERVVVVCDQEIIAEHPRPAE